MATAVIEDPRTTRYRRKLADLLRRPSCRWMSFAIGMAPVHRGFFDDTAEAIEGLPTGDVHDENGVTHRQVQYGVRLRIGSGADNEAFHDAERDVLVVPGEDAFGDLDGQAKLIRACVHLGLDIADRNHHRLDSECAARIAGHLYRLFESIPDPEQEAEIEETIRRLTPELPADKAFYDIAVQILHHLRATLRAHRRFTHPLQPGSFMKIVGTDRREQLHEIVSPRAVRQRRQLPRPMIDALPRASRFLALQPLELATLPDRRNSSSALSVWPAPGSRANLSPA